MYTWFKKLISLKTENWKLLSTTLVIRRNGIEMVVEQELFTIKILYCCYIKKYYSADYKM